MEKISLVPPLKGLFYKDLLHKTTGHYKITSPKHTHVIPHLMLNLNEYLSEKEPLVYI